MRHAAGVISLGVSAWAMAGCGSDSSTTTDLFAPRYDGDAAHGSGVAVGSPQAGAQSLDATIAIPNDGSGGAAISGEAGEAGCGASTLDATTRPVNVLLVVDTSGSMNEQPAGFATSKWTALKTSLSVALQKVQGSIGVGTEFFPFASDGKTPVCQVPSGGASIQIPVGPTTVTLSRILAAMDAHQPAGGTPTALALQRASEYFTVGDGKALPGDKYVLLATDGGPNCDPSVSCDSAHCTTNLDRLCPAAAGNCCDAKYGANASASCIDADHTVAQIAALQSAGIKTIVVGIPGAEAYASSLSRFAAAGGASAPGQPEGYYAVKGSGGVDGLTAVLTSITTKLITTCRLQLTTSPPDPNQLNVSIDGVVTPKTGDNGWDLDLSSSPPAIVLKGSTCVSIQQKGADHVVIEYGCPTILIR